MITPAQRAEVRRLFYAEHWKLGTIATQLGLHADAVRAAVEADAFRNARGVVRPSALDPYKAFIAATLDRYPRLRATRVFEMVRARGYAGAVKTVRRYIRTVRPRGRAEAFLRLATLPGEQAQVDWASFGPTTVAGATRSLSCFVMVLSHSRALYARFFLDQTLPSFLRGHVAAFAAFGGAPREVLYDNLKSAVLSRVGEHIEYQPQLLALAGHYHFAPKPCAPYRGNEKGKVERQIQYLRHAFFAARPYRDLDDLNAQLARWIAEVAHARPVPEDPDRRSVADAFAAERTHLVPLPARPFPCDLVRATTAHKTPYVRFDDNDYSVPPDHVGRPLTLVASDREVRVLDGQAEVARHARSYGRKARVEDPAHLAALVAEKRAGAALRGRDALRDVCPHADAFLAALAARNLPLRVETARLGKLLARYGAADLDAALAAALARGAASAASVAHWLDQRDRARGAPPPLPVALPDDPRVRDLRVEPHALDRYDALGAAGEADRG